MDTNKLQRMGRRRFMENLAAVGVSSATLQNLTQDELTNVTHDPEEEVPYVAMWENTGTTENGEVTREPVYETIPREQWERRQTALNVRDKISETLDQELDDGRFSVAFTSMDQSPTDFGVKVNRIVTEDSSGDIREPNFGIKHLEDSLPRSTVGEIPSLDEEVTREGIPIAVSESKQSRVGGSNQYDDMPGGVPIYTTISGGTLCAPFHSREYGDGWATAGHLVKDEKGSEGDLVYQVFLDENSDDWLGNPEQGYFDDQNLDYAFINDDSDEDLSSWLTDESSDKQYELTGIVSNEELENKVGDDDYVLTGKGSTTGINTGTIEQVHGAGTEAVETNWSVEDGDSGGPVFYTPNSDEAYIAGITFADVWWNDTKATTAETAEIEMDGYFIWN